ncbi:MAG: 2-dehydropantoate 2-reductase [Candidatus Hodarchaeales archaeon]|jgi:2-dehydropantoate 2-reductase
MWKDKKIVVFGVGGVGGYFGGLLAKKGLNVTFIARGESLNIMKRKGLRVESVDGDFIINPVQVTDNPSEIGPVSLVMVCVKAPQVSEVVHLLKPLIGEETIILPLQNGVDTPSQLIEIYGLKNVVGGLCKVLSFKAGSGHIRHLGVSIIEFGEMEAKISSRVKELKDMFTSAGITAITHDDFPVALWAKMALICALGGVTAVTRSSIGTIRSLPETREMLEKSMLETVHVAQKLGINLSERIVDTMMGMLDGIPEESTTSLQRDIMEGRPSELHFLVGSIAKSGEKVGISVPINRFIYHSLLPMEIKAREK